MEFIKSERKISEYHRPFGLIAKVHCYGCYGWLCTNLRVFLHVAFTQTYVSEFVVEAQQTLNPDESVSLGIQLICVGMKV